jgi:peptide chain release factor 1
MKSIRQQVIEAQNILKTGKDSQLRSLAQQEISRLIKQYINQTPELSRNAFLEIRAGAGGDEAELFAGELLRMYQKLAEKQGWKITVIRQNQSELNGIKEAILKVKGAGAYGWLLAEAGIHRVQRVPKTEKSGRIHTSAVSVVVLPEVPETELKINPKDIKMDVFRSSGHGGQSVNTTDSAVRITHLPTNITVTCQDERSQLKNRVKAMAELRSRLYQKQKEEERQSAASARSEMIKTGDRSDKIRTYNFPQDRVTDHRIKKSWPKLKKIMDGEIRDILENYWIRKLTSL